jgi:hypothetical protein
VKMKKMTPQEAAERWAEFESAFINWPWFEAEDRPKTVRALQLLARRMPTECFDALPPLLVLAPSPAHLGWALEFVQQPSTSKHSSAFIYLSPELESKPQRRVNSCVAHEVAHVVLGHYKLNGNHTPTQTDLKQMNPGRLSKERQADRLIRQWGYCAAYHCNR